MIFGAISSFVSSVVSTAVSAVVSSVSSFVATVAPVILNTIKTVVDVVETIGLFLQVLQPDEKIEDLGDRTLQAGEAGITPEKFETYDEYLTAIRNFELDPAKTEKYRPEEKQLAGIATTCRGIEDKFDLREGTMASLVAYVALDKTYFTQERILSWITTPSLDKGKLVDMFDKNLNAKESYQIGNEIIALEKQNHPEKDEKTIESELMSAMEKVEQGIELTKENQG